MASVSSPRSGRPATPGTPAGTPGTPGSGAGAARFPSPRVDSPLSLGARGAWTSGPNAIIWSRHDADLDEEPRELRGRAANAASRDHAAGVPARPPPPVKLYSLKRAWLMMNAAGETAALEATKMEMQRELGVPFRDLMILDPALPTAYPSAIFIRPRAIVVNMEHVKLVVTSGLVASPLPPLDERGGDADATFARRFTRRLKRQLAAHASRTDAFKAGAAEACEEDLTLPSVHDKGDIFDQDDGLDGIDGPRVRENGAFAAATEAAFLAPTPDANDVVRETKDANAFARRAFRADDEPPHDEKAKAPKPSELKNTDLLGLRQTPCELRVLLLPFELRVVEAALHDVCKRLLEETVALERDAAPALEALAERVSSASLEKTRGIKAAMNALAARVGAAREALEKLLRDDADMAAMRLSRGDASDETSDDEASDAALPLKGASEGSVGSAEGDAEETPARISAADETGRRDDSLESPARARAASTSRASRSGGSGLSAGADAEAHEGVEALLEAYFMHCDYSFKRLNELRGSVEDTEDLAEIKLDSQRNQLIKVDLMLSNGALAVGAFSTVVGAFGMNLPTGLEASRDAFAEVLFVSAVVCVALFVAVVVACRRWKLLQM